MTGHLEDFVGAINPLHSSKAGSGCEVKPGWKGQALLRIWVFVPGGTEGHLQASLLIMGIFISPWGAAPACGCLPEQELQGWLQARGSRAIPADDTGKEKVSVLVTKRNVMTWGSSQTHQLLYLPEVARGGCSHVAPKLGDLVFSRWVCSECPFTAFSCLAPHPFHISPSEI